MRTLKDWVIIIVGAAAIIYGLSAVRYFLVDGSDIESIQLYEVPDNLIEA